MIYPETFMEIAHLIHSGKCTPVLGAACNVTDGTRGYVGLPLGAEVAEQLLKRLSLTSSDKELDINLPSVALFYDVKYRNRYDLLNSLQEILSNEQICPSPLLKTLAALPFRLIITTNFDHLMEKALHEAGKPCKVIIQPTDGFNEYDREMVDEEINQFQGVVVYKLHGSFVQEENLPKSKSQIVISEDDYIRFMGMMKNPHWAPYTIREKLRSNLLFLGYSIKDWDFRSLLFERPYGFSEAFAILRDNPSEFWFKYLQYIGIKPYSMHIYDFSDELQKYYEHEYA